MAKDTDFKFGMDVPRDSPDMSLEKFFKKGAWSWSRDPFNFWALSANSSKKDKDTNFKFGTHAPMGGPDMNPKTFFRKEDIANGHVTP